MFFILLLVHLSKSKFKSFNKKNCDLKRLICFLIFGSKTIDMNRWLWYYSSLCRINIALFLRFLNESWMHQLSNKILHFFIFAKEEKILARHIYSHLVGDLCTLKQRYCETFPPTKTPPCNYSLPKATVLLGPWFQDFILLVIFIILVWKNNYKTFPCLIIHKNTWFYWNIK